jgi:hypothetical protein
MSEVIEIKVEYFTEEAFALFDHYIDPRTQARVRRRRAPGASVALRPSAWRLRLPER